MHSSNRSCDFLFELAVFSTEDEDELSFVAGDLIILEERIDEVWLKGYLRSPEESGIFPAEFVEVVVCMYGSALM